MLLTFGLAVAAAGAQLVKAQAGFSALPYSFITPYNHSCVLDDTYPSCPPQDPSKVDSCCAAETYGGLVLATQFWSTYTGLESKGQLLPNSSWTLHGLWPDFCNGSYTGYCDVARQYDPVPSPNVSSTGVGLPRYTGNVTGNSVLSAFGRFDLLSWMNKYWINQGDTNDAFWMHEYSKHATCYSNFQVECYGPQYKKNEEIVDFFDTAIQAFQRYPTYKWLAMDNIVPSNGTNYTYSDIQTSLTKASGAVPYIGCSGTRYNETAAGRGSNDTGRTVISEVWYYNYAQGRVQDLKLQPVNSTSPSGCAKAAKALMYPLRAAGSEHPIM